MAFWGTVTLSGPWCSLPWGTITLLLASSSVDKGDVDNFETLPRPGRQRFPLSLPQHVFNSLGKHPKRFSHFAAFALKQHVPKNANVGFQLFGPLCLGCRGCFIIMGPSELRVHCHPGFRLLLGVHRQKNCSQKGSVFSGDREVIPTHLKRAESRIPNC